VRVVLLLLLSTLGVHAATGTVIRFRAVDATVSGGPKLENKGGITNVGHWMSIDGLVQWKTNLPARGTYRVIAMVACEARSEGAEIVVDVGPQRANAVIPSTGSWDRFIALDLGPVILRQPGELPVTVRALRKPRYAVMNLREIRLVPEN
jgi:hypothetical protein